jgi:hypothetical protein
MVFHNAQARIIEALLACLLITLALVISDPYFLSSSIVKGKEEKKDLATKVLSFLLYKDILKRAYYRDYYSIQNALNEIIPLEYGFKFSIYDDSWNLLWSYQRSYFNEGDSDSSFVILNGCDGIASNQTLIFVLAVS